MKTFINTAFAWMVILLLTTGCKKFYDPVLDQNQYKPDSSNSVAATNKRRVLVIGIDGLPASVVKSVAPSNIMGLLPHSKYSWDVALPVIRTESDITLDGSLKVALELSAGAAGVNGSSKLVDYNPASFYYAGPIQSYLPNLWIQQEFSSNLPVVEAYELTSAPENATQNWRDPKDWTIQASNDVNGPWVILDTKYGEIFTARNQTKRYEIENTVPYRYYRMVISAINAIQYTGYLQLAEWHLIKYLLTSGGNAGSWTGMLTGKDITQHRVFDSSFYPKPIDSSATTPLSPNISVLQLLYNHKPGTIRTAAVSSWNNLVNTMLRDADLKVKTNSDADTKDQLVNILKNDSARVIISQFGDVFLNGMQYGFTETATPYLNAISKTDNYVGEIMEALQSRSTYKDEEWLVIVTTTQGGSGLDRAPISPGFFIAQNPAFQSQDLSLMNPAVNVLQQDLTPQILYWMKTPQSSAIQKGQLWLDRFSIEFLK